MFKKIVVFCCALGLQNFLFAAAGTTPIYTITPNIGIGAVWTNGTTANTKSDGTGTIGTDILLAYKAGANGAFVQKVRLVPTASVAGTGTTATVARIYISSITSGATANTNTFRWDEVACSSQAVDNAITGNSVLEIPMGFAIPSNSAILFSMHAAAAANTAWQCIVIANDY